MEGYLSKIPKAELHIHIEGSFEPELMFEIAKRNNLKISFNSVEALKAAYNFNNLQEFLDIYYQGAGVLITEKDFYDLTYAYLKKAAADNVVHTEIFFDPQTHTDRGISFDTVMEGITSAMEDAEKELGITSFLIMSFLRHLSEEEAFKTLEQSLPWREKILGIGLDSSEVGNPPQKFVNVYAKCREMGFKLMAHAGEEGPAEYVKDSLDLLKIDRIDHGNRCLDDPALVDRIVAEGKALTVCPLSNYKLRVVKDMKNHPLKTMLDKGLKATVNSDDPAYFGGYVNDNFRAVQQSLNLTKQDIKTLAVNSIEASFLSEDKKRYWVEEIEKFHRNHS
jgi:adenosine deaminase